MANEMTKQMLDDLYQKAAVSIRAMLYGPRQKVKKRKQDDYVQRLI